MKYTVYLDVLFLVNFGMDYLIVWLTGRLCHKEMIWWRSLISSLTGAVLLVILVWIPIPAKWIYYICCYGVIGLLMCFLAFRPGTWKAVITCYFCQLLVTFLLGGIMNWLYLATPFGTWIAGLTGSKGLQLRELMLLVIISGIIFSVLTSGFRQIRRETGTVYYDVSLYFDEENIYGKGLLDTGNFLVEPLSRQPVMVAEADWIWGILPGAYQELVHTYLEQGKIDYDQIAREGLTRARWIPYQAVGETNGELLGIQCRRIVIRQKDTCITRENVIVGISRTPITNNNRYQILLHTDIVEREEFVCCR